MFVTDYWFTGNSELFSTSIQLWLQLSKNLTWLNTIKVYQYEVIYKLHIKITYLYDHEVSHENITINSVFITHN